MVWMVISVWLIVYEAAPSQALPPGPELCVTLFSLPGGSQGLSVESGVV